jgi:hypothetical protein
MNNPTSVETSKYGIVFCLILMVAGIGSAHAQVLIANEDNYGIPYGETLIVEFFGVLDNDLLNGEAAGENGATSELVADVGYGTLSLGSDGSFSYTPGPGFDGTDSFVYRAVFGSVADTTTVTLSACSGGPDVFTCWSETAFLAKAAEFGYTGFQEGFENDAVWGIARSPTSAPVVSSQGIQWQSNHPDAPASNEIITGSGPARTGAWGLYDPEHGYATGSAIECDINNPPVHCLYNDGFTGVRVTGQSPLRGVGGYITGTHAANVAIAIDGAIPIGGGRVYAAHQFFGVIDARPAGFTQFEFRELDGKVGQALFIFGDDFTMLTSETIDVPETRVSEMEIAFSGPNPNPSDGNTTLRFSLPTQATARLSVYDQRGRLVRELGVDLPGGRAHAITWDGRDREGNAVGTGIYFARLVVNSGAQRNVLTRKIVVSL